MRSSHDEGIDMMSSHDEGIGMMSSHGEGIDMMFSHDEGIDMMSSHDKQSSPRGIDLEEVFRVQSSASPPLFLILSCALELLKMAHLSACEKVWRVPLRSFYLFIF